MTMTTARSHRIVATLAALGLAATGLLAAPTTASAATPDLSVKGVPTVVARMNAHHIGLSVGHDMRAGRVMFKVVAANDHNHTLQIFRLHRGYTPQEAQADFGKAFSGDVPAINRIDDNVTFLGGAQAKPGKPGWFSVKLPANKFMVVDQDGPASTFLRVHGTAPKRPTVHHQSRITALSYGFDPSEKTMPAEGWTYVSNHSDQPHFIVMNRVKDNTTRKMVKHFFDSGAQGNPSWALHASTNTGVISPYKNETFHYDLPAGKYLVLCFWPDDETGMPHALMGMWHFVQLS